jgi:hypothetical protein
VRRHCAAALITEGYVDTGSPSRLVSGPAAMVVPFFFMIDWSSCPVFENLEDGALVSEFEDWFPGVGLEQVRAVLDHAARSALATS